LRGIRYITTDGQSGCQEPIWDRVRNPSGTGDHIHVPVRELLVFLFLCSLPDQRTDVQFAFVGGTRQPSLSRVPVPGDSRIYFTVYFWEVWVRRAHKLTTVCELIV
jgi:hypothetical protein